MKIEMDIDRQLLDKEKELWDRVKHWEQNNYHSVIPVTELGRQVGLHEERTRQIARTWENDGLMYFPLDYNNGKLTEAGRQHDFND